MTTEHLLYFLLLALLAEILGTIGGFGSSMFFVPIASYFMDFHSVLGITAVFHVSSNIAKITLFRQGLDYRLVVWLGIPAVLAVIVGAWLSQYVPTNWLTILLASFLIVLSLLLLIFRNFVLPPTLPVTLTGGAISGLLAGLLGTGGAVRGLTLAAFNLKTDTFIATSVLIDLCIDASRSVIYTWNGYVHTHDLYLIPLLLVVSFVGTWLGKKILAKMSEDQFRTWVLWLILLTGLFALVKPLL
ncbi:MAG TPA: hypothetical protein DCM08_09645 [Microscillaceae bacterium]|nr:hypothetical protein [Microscillaceae bacterium]